MLDRLTNSIGKGGRNGSLFEGDIAEIILYNRFLSAAEQQVVANYLAEKYGSAIP